MRSTAGPRGRSLAMVSCTLTMGAALAACGQEASDATSADTPTTSANPEVSPLAPCDLATPDALKEATGRTFNDGEEHGPECYFSTADYSMTASVSTGLKTVADHLDTKQITINGLDAVQGASPEGDQCQVDVTLKPDAPTDILSTSVSGATPADQPCDMTKGIAEKALANVKG